MLDSGVSPDNMSLGLADGVSVGVVSSPTSGLVGRSVSAMTLYVGDTDVVTGPIDGEPDIEVVICAEIEGMLLIEPSTVNDGETVGVVNGLTSLGLGGTLDTGVGLLEGGTFVSDADVIGLAEAEASLGVLIELKVAPGVAMEGIGL